MSGKLAKKITHKYMTELRDLTGFVFHHRDVEIIADAVEEGMIAMEKAATSTMAIAHYECEHPGPFDLCNRQTCRLYKAAVSALLEEK